MSYSVEIVYLISSVLFIMGLKGLSHPESARRGMHYAEVGMLLAVVGTLVSGKIVTWEWIITGLFVGSAIGAAMAVFMPMTAMPERIALSHAFGALAAVLVGINEYLEKSHGGISNGLMSALGFEVLFGALTVTGSLMAFGKLNGMLPSVPMTYKGQNAINISLFFITLGMLVYLIFVPSDAVIFYTMIVLSFVIGIFIVMPIGGADMPVVISLMNSYAGLAAAATGFAIDNKVLIIAGSLDGSSGFILSVIMSNAMNRSFANVLFGAVGTPQVSTAELEQRPVTRFSVEETKFALEQSKRVVIVPGYGMAVAQAQHAVYELGEELEKQGIKVEFGIHPVAGRMPGHMNVLLAEANVSYDQLLEMDAINPSMDTVDVCIVIGANDVVNPAARTDKGSPIYGMPIIDVDKAKTVIVMKRSMAAGFAGIENPLFYEANTRMLFGDAKKVMQELVALFKT